MPELPEVERARRLIEGAGRGRRIEGVETADDEIVFDETSPAGVEAAVRGRRIVGAGRRGKHLWIELDERPWVLVHLGMAGHVRAKGVEPIRLKSDGAGPLSTTWPPGWMKLRLVLDDGGEIAVTDKRRFGRVRLREDPLHEPPVSGLGFDVLLDLPSPKAFAALLSARSVTIKGLLLDQSFAAGVGNWIADEVLYQARIDPRRRARDLSLQEAKRVRAALKRVVEKAVSVNADKTRLPAAWLFHRRWDKRKGATTARGEAIEHLTVAGRTTAWVPDVQE